MKASLACCAVLIAIAAWPKALADDDAKPACLRAKSVNGWVKGNEQIVQLHTAGKRWRVVFTEPCLKEKPIAFRFGLRVGSYCVEPGDEIVFVTIGGYEQYCRIARIEPMQLGEKIVPDVPDAPQADH